MSREMARTIASALAIVGVIFFAAGLGLHFLPREVGILGGVVSWLIAASIGGLRAVWRE